jgi:hypothetical protein
MEYMNTLSSALDYSRNGQIEEWIHLYLNLSANNKEFSDGLKLFDRFYIGPIKMPITLFARCCGPEDDMKWKVDKEAFEKRVSLLQQSIKHDFDMPPLIIQYVDGHFELNDGNHRYEAYIRSGVKEIYVIVWITKRQDNELFKIKYANYMSSFLE